MALGHVAMTCGGGGEWSCLLGGGGWVSGGGTEGRVGGGEEEGRFAGCTKFRHHHLRCRGQEMKHQGGRDGGKGYEGAPEPTPAHRAPGRRCESIRRHLGCHRLVSSGCPPPPSSTLEARVGRSPMNIWSNIWSSCHCHCQTNYFKQDYFCAAVQGWSPTPPTSGLGGGVGGDGSMGPCVTANKARDRPKLVELRGREGGHEVRGHGGREPVLRILPVVLAVDDLDPVALPSVLRGVGAQGPGPSHSWLG